ncbi:6-phosphogluconolactonase [Dactylosporangium sp. CA-092794]|uniref:6-phosphogluconolactonase n=1 Tax=Dactylosporangium sp. CA-092794 TaxID=3239929 RepID=UPI003D920085
MTQSKVVVHTEARLLAEAAAARLIVRLTDAQAERGEATLVLTGGRIAAQIYQAIRESPARDAVDWSRVNLWWGDERFLPSGDPERNETQARAALLDALKLDPARVHPMAPSDGPDGTDAEAAAARYAAELAEATRPGSAELPHFDVVLLGIGEDGHVASVFPEHPVTFETRPVSAVRGSPKPPPVRITLTLPAINTTDEAWLIASGSGKASAVGLALADAGPRQVPAAGVHGRDLTLWLLDSAAAHELPPKFRSLV